MAIEGYFLGCPMWGFEGWVGVLYSRDARPPDFLEEYASVFNAVEGNTTFYSSPAPGTVDRWRRQTPDAGFRFCFKLPSTITHELGLVDAGTETRAFLARVSPLGGRLGPFMIQLPARFGPDRFAVLESFLRRLPRDFDYAVEMRHIAYHREPLAGRVDELLGELEIDRVILDTGALRSGDPRHPGVAGARHDKPRLPAPPRRTGKHGFLRWIGHPVDEVDLPSLGRWAGRVSRWIREGRTPHVFIHCPDNTHAPRLARRFHESLSEALPGGRAGTLPEWPAARDQPVARQLRLL